MKTLAELNLPSDRFYTDEHIWAVKENDTFLIGISDFAQDQLGEIMYIELPEKNSTYKSAQDFGTIESVKSVNKLFAPFDFTVLEVNSKLEDTPTIINGDCYTKGWIIRVKANNIADYNNLLKSDAYKTLLAK